MTITKELTGEELNQKMKDMFPTREDYEQMHKAMALEFVWGGRGTKES